MIPPSTPKRVTSSYYYNTTAHNSSTTGLFTNNNNNNTNFSDEEHEDSNFRTPNHLVHGHNQEKNKTIRNLDKKHNENASINDNNNHDTITNNNDTGLLVTPQTVSRFKNLLTSGGAGGNSSGIGLRKSRDEDFEDKVDLGSSTPLVSAGSIMGDSRSSIGNNNGLHRNFNDFVALRYEDDNIGGKLNANSGLSFLRSPEYTPAKKVVDSSTSAVQLDINSNKNLSNDVLCNNSNVSAKRNLDFLLSNNALEINSHNQNNINTNKNNEQSDGQMLGFVKIKKIKNNTIKQQPPSLARISRIFDDDDDSDVVEDLGICMPSTPNTTTITEERSGPSTPQEKIISFEQAEMWNNGSPIKNKKHRQTEVRHSFRSIRGNSEHHTSEVIDDDYGKEEEEEIYISRKILKNPFLDDNDDKVQEEYYDEEIGRTPTKPYRNVNIFNNYGKCVRNNDDDEVIRFYEDSDGNVVKKSNFSKGRPKSAGGNDDTTLEPKKLVFKDD